MRTQGFGRNEPSARAWSMESWTWLKWIVPLREIADPGAGPRPVGPVECEHVVLEGVGTGDLGVVHEVVGLLMVATRCPNRGSRWSRPVFSRMTWLVGHARSPQLLGRHVHEVDPVQQRQLGVLGLARMARRRCCGGGAWAGVTGSGTGRALVSSRIRSTIGPDTSFLLQRDDQRLLWPRAGSRSGQGSQPRSGRPRRSTPRLPRGPRLARCTSTPGWLPRRRGGGPTDPVADVRGTSEAATKRGDLREVGDVAGGDRARSPGVR